MKLCIIYATQALRLDLLPAYWLGKQSHWTQTSCNKNACSRIKKKKLLVSYNLILRSGLVKTNMHCREFNKPNLNHTVLKANLEQAGSLECICPGVYCYCTFCPQHSFHSYPLERWNQKGSIWFFIQWHLEPFCVHHIICTLAISMFDNCLGQRSAMLFLKSTHYTRWVAIENFPP